MMKKVILLITILMIVVIAAAVFTGCGDEKKADSVAEDETKTSETTAVIETTSQGGTVEQDSEGNRITRDSDGKIVSAEDKDGNPLDVDEYLATHTWVEAIISPGDSAANNGTSGNSGKNQQNDPAKGSSENNSGNDPQEDIVEGSIPVIIATFPDDEDLIELPDL